jgi:hypothetical protein
MHDLRNTAPRLLTTLGLVALAAVGLLGCPNETVMGDGETSGSELLAGTLVITEIVANVPGADAGLEWFELYNASNETVDLEGLTLVYEKVDGTGRKTHTIARSVEVAPGGYVVVGSLLDELAQGSAHVDYGYAGELGDFGNTAGYIAIESSDETVDETYYEGPSENASRSFDGSQSPDSLANDNSGNWCDSRTELSEGFAATPGAANDVCGGATTCLQDGQAIPIVHPTLGEIVITEVLPNPDFVADDVGEWFELHSLANADFHLNGLQIGKSIAEAAEDVIAWPECITLSPGAYAIVAKSADPMQNGELPSELVVWETDISLTNSNSSLWVGVAAEILDAVSWGTAGTGEATQLDPDFFDPIANDDLGNWCDATEPFNGGDVGTPGAANSECFIEPPEGQCYENGELRDISPVAMGDLEIVEIMPNPAAVDDGDGEWFELRVASSGDLNGLEISKGGMISHVVEFGDAPGFASDACITVMNGDTVVFAHDDDPLINGGIPQVDVLFDMALNNSGSDLTIGYDGVTWATHAWATSTSGASLSKDSLDTWCDAVDPYGDGDLGTPGEANPMCGGGMLPGCIDPNTMLMRMFDPPMPGELELSEIMPDPAGAPDATGEWFEIHALGAFDLNGLELGKANVINHTVSSNMCIEIAADSYVVFGRSNIDGENCTLPVDYVYDTLSLTNSNGNLQVGHGGVVLSEHSWASSSAGTAFSYDPMAMQWCAAVEPFGCGDRGTPGAVNPACGGGGGDGQCFDVDMMMMRDPVAPGLGDLVITEFMANPNAVSDAAGEWFELRALAAVDLNGLQLGQAFVDGPVHVVTSVDCIPLQPGANALLARNDDVLTNGGLPEVVYEYSTLNLSNANTFLHIAVAGVLLDEVGWSAVATGRSTTLDPDSQDPALNDLGNNALPWCYTPADVMYQFAGGDYGTPGEDNMQCP